MEKPNFWDRTHSLFNDYEKLYEQLIPDEGNSSSLQGELLRAASRIGYDWYNNGWGCNNWSGAVVFLKRFFRLLPNQPEQDKMGAFTRSLRWVSNYSHGEPTESQDDDDSFDIAADEHCTVITETVVQALLDNPTLIPNTRDMWDHQEKDYREPISERYW